MLLPACRAWARMGRSCGSGHAVDYLPARESNGARRTPGAHMGYKDGPRPALSRTPANPYVAKLEICDLRALLGFGAAFETPILKHLLGGRRHPLSRLHRQLHGRLRPRLLNH